MKMVHAHKPLTKKLDAFRQDCSKMVARCEVSNVGTMVRFGHYLILQLCDALSVVNEYSRC